MLLCTIRIHENQHAPAMLVQHCYPQVPFPVSRQNICNEFTISLIQFQTIALLQMLACIPHIHQQKNTDLHCLFNSAIPKLLSQWRELMDDMKRLMQSKHCEDIVCTRCSHENFECTCKSRTGAPSCKSKMPSRCQTYIQATQQYGAFFEDTNLGIYFWQFNLISEITNRHLQFQFIVVISKCLCQVKCFVFKYCGLTIFEFNDCTRI